MWLCSITPGNTLRHSYHGVGIIAIAQCQPGQPGTEVSETPFDSLVMHYTQCIPVIRRVPMQDVAVFYHSWEHSQTLLPWRRDHSNSPMPTCPRCNRSLRNTF